MVVATLCLSQAEKHFSQHLQVWVLTSTIFQDMGRDWGQAGNQFCFDDLLISVPGGVGGDLEDAFLDLFIGNGTVGVEQDFFGNGQR